MAVLFASCSKPLLTGIFNIDQRSWDSLCELSLPWSDILSFKHFLGFFFWSWPGFPFTYKLQSYICFSCQHLNRRLQAVIMERNIRSVLSHYENRREFRQNYMVGESNSCRQEYMVLAEIGCMWNFRLRDRMFLLEHLAVPFSKKPQGNSVPAL